MSTPEKFYHINPDIKPGVIPNNDDHVRTYRPSNQPRTDKNFERILDKRDDKPTEDTNEVAKEGTEEKDRVAKKDPTTSKEEKKEAFVKETTQPDLDPRFNQAPTVDKDSKVAPKLGEEITTAPAEEPRAVGYVDSPEKQKGKVTIPGDQMATKEGTEGVVKAMPAEKQAMKLPKEQNLQKPGNVLSDKQEVPKSPSQLFSSMADDAKKSAEDAGRLHGQIGDGSVNLMTGQGGEQGMNVAAAGAQAMPERANMTEMINKIADQLSVISTDSKADSTITLKNLPTFEGVSVTVTSYPTARGEINITFENLTQEGKLLLDMVDNRAALKQALDQKGYIVHMITTTTTTIERTFTESGGAQKENRGGTRDEMAGDGGGQQKQDQNQDA